MSAGPSMPVGTTRNGNLFKDRSDANLNWYLPAFTTVDATDGFSFAASEGTTVDSSGNPFDSAAVTLALRPVDPPDVAAARQATPSASFQAIPPLAYTASLLLPYKDPQGADQTTSVPGKVAPQGDGTILLTFAGLLGPTVTQAYEHLSDVGGASVQLGWTYHVWDQFFKPIRRLPPIHVDPGELHPRIHPATAPIFKPAPAAHAKSVVRPGPAPRSTTAVQPALAVDPAIAVPPNLPVQPLAVDRPRVPIISNGTPERAPVPKPIHILGPIGPLRPLPPPSQGIWTMLSASASGSVALGGVYAGGSYRLKYTITTRDGTTRAIIDASDLKSFVTPRSEFRALTSLGDVQTRYPSMEGLYYGQVSGTVVVIPAAYGIVRGKGGCVARLDSVVDTSPTSVSGCRFQFTFNVAPVVDPIDLAQLAADLATVPEASAGPLQPVLPSGIDRRVTPTYSAPVSNLVFADSPDGIGVLMSFQVTDSGTTPALVNVNLLLAQFTSASSTPLFGTIGVQLDDVYTPPVQATVVTGLTVTSATDDLAATTAEATAAISLTNQSPNDVTLVRMRAATAQGADTEVLNNVLPAGECLDVPVTDAATLISVLVERALSFPNPFPRSALPDYLDLHAETVQQAMHSLSINATGIDFNADAISEIDAVITLDTLPTVAVPPLALRPEHEVDSANVVVPIDAALTGLSATLTITVHSSDGSPDRQAQVKNDFAANPILVLTLAALQET